MLTDTLNPYPNDSISYAYFTFPTSQFNSSYWLTFKHKFDTEINVDGGYIEYYDCYNDVWLNLITSPGMVCSGYYPFYFQNNPNTTLVNSEVGFSGTSTGWETTEISLYCGLVFGESQNRGGWSFPQFRFAFVSDSNNTNQEGWMIDDIYWMDLEGVCSGIVENENQLQLSVYPNLTDGKISFETENELFSSITIYDFSGKQIENFIFSPSNFKTLQLSNLSNGMYFYSVDDGKAMGKFIIEK